MGGYVFRETANIPPHTLGLKSIFSPESSSLQSHLHLSSMVRASEIERSVFSPALYHHISVSIHLISLSSYNSHIHFLTYLYRVKSSLATEKKEVSGTPSVLNMNKTCHLCFFFLCKIECVKFWFRKKWLFNKICWFKKISSNCIIIPLQCIVAATVRTRPTICLSRPATTLIGKHSRFIDRIYPNRKTTLIGKHSRFMIVMMMIEYISRVSNYE